MKTVLLVPARAGSDRLPHKHLYPLTEQGENALSILYDRLRPTGLPMRLVVGAGDRLYESIGRCIGWEVLRTGWVKEGDLLSTLKEGVAGFDRAVVVYGDSPLVDASLINLLPDAPFAHLIAPPGLRPFSFTARFLDEWIRELLKEQPMPFTSIRFPKSWATVGVRWDLGISGDERYSLDTISDVTWLRHLFRFDSTTKAATMVWDARTSRGEREGDEKPELERSDSDDRSA